MKLTSKQSWLLLAIVQAAILVTCATNRPAASEATVDVWTSDGGRPVHMTASTARAVCAPAGSDRAGWELRLDGSATDAVRRVDIEIPRVETRGTESFYAGVTTMRDGSVHQWMIETRPQAARRIGDGHAWAEADHSSVSATVVARVESDWYFLALRCPIPH